MSRLIKSRDYLKKCLGFILLFGFISLGAIGGCNNNGGGQDGTRALTENDFVNDPTKFANAEKGVVVTFLEHPGSEEPENDTGEIGNDVIPFKYKSTLNHTICWEDDNVDSKHFMILLNSDGKEVLRVEANGGCVTEVIEAGDYKMVLTHGGHDDDIDPVFLTPAPEDEQVTKRDEFDQKEIKTANAFSYKMHRYLPGGLVKFFESISNVFTSPARAQTTDPNLLPNVTTLINTNACGECDLSGASLMGANLSGAELGAANLSGANLFGADLSGAELNCAFLCGADLTFANLSGADLSEAFLGGGNLSNAQLNNCPVTDGCQGVADLCSADLSQANLTGADLGQANLTGTTILSFATWIDGSTCDICH